MERSKVVRAVILAALCVFLLGSECPNNPFQQRISFEITLQSPPEGATIYVPEVMLDWSVTSSSSGKIVNNICIGRTTDCGVTYSECGVHVYGEGRDSRGGERSEWRTFTTHSYLPSVDGGVYNPFPADGAINTDTILGVTCDFYRPAHLRDDTITFDFYLGTATDPPLIGSGLDSIFRGVDRDSLESGTTYYWRVNTIYRATYRPTPDTVVGPLWSFTTNEFNLPQIYDPTPADSSTGVDSTTHLSWTYQNPGPGTERFDLYFGTATDPPLAATGLTSAAYNPGVLEGATDYFWRVVIYNDADTVSGPVWTFQTEYSAFADAFALFEVDVQQAPSGWHVLELIKARFDTGLAIDAPIMPLQADSVLAEGMRLDWSPSEQGYRYEEMSMPFLTSGEDVDFTVYGNAVVPHLATAALLPACTLGITWPDGIQPVTISGFEVRWNCAPCEGDVWLTLMKDGDSTGVWKQVANDGRDSLTAVDLSPLSGVTGRYDLIIMTVTEDAVLAPGYIPGSLIRTRVFNRILQISISSL